MKKRFFSILLVLALILTALAGCSGPNAADSTESPSTEDNEEEQLLSNGYYEVHDEDDELVGYLRVTSSKIVVYDEHGSEEDSLRYDYDAKTKLYTLDDGKLFGCEEFTVEKSGNALTLITGDEDEYTLEEIDKSDMPGGGEETPSDEPGSDHVELPAGCYAGYDDSNIFGYLKVTDSTMIFYYDDGEIEIEARYSYDSDGSCVLEMDGNTVTVRFTYEQDSYYINNGSESRRLEPISEDEIPTNNAPSDLEAYYIGANGSIALHAWLPEALYDNLSLDNKVGGFTAQAEYYDDTGTELMFSAIVASGNALRGAVDEAKADYNGVYSSDADLLFNYRRESFIVSSLGSDYPGDIEDGYETINAREWRYCQTYAEIEGEGGIARALFFWMEGDDMALVMVGGHVGSSGNYDVMTGIVTDIISSLKIDA